MVQLGFRRSNRLSKYMPRGYARPTRIADAADPDPDDKNDFCE
jgi:hypothetical protein